MSEPAPFPEDDAATVLEAAAALDAATLSGSKNMTAAAVVLDSIRQLIGEPRIPAALATEWGAAQNTPSTVATRLNDKLGSLDTYWQGNAFDAFATHTGRVIQQCDLTAEKLGAVGGLLATAIGFVHETWGMAIGFIVKAAAACVNLLDPAGVLTAISDLASSYADLLESAIVTMGGFAANVKAIEISAIGFPEPGELPSEVKNPDLWAVEPPPAHPPEDKKSPGKGGVGESQGGVIEDEPADEPAGLEETPA